MSEGNGKDAGSNLGLQERNGTVILTLPDKCNYAILPHELATEIGTEMCRLAYVAKTGSTPKSRDHIAEQIREKMQTRCQVILTKELQKKTKLTKIANTLVDVILREAL